MKKFSDIYKKQLNESEALHENNVVNDFKKIYNALLEHYNLTAIHDLNEKSQLSFLTELNQYWSEEHGLSELGKSFIQRKDMRLNENSTPLQKRNYLKTKASNILSETLRQTDMKYKMYVAIDEMYEQVKAQKIEDVMSPNVISDIITEVFAEKLDEFVSNIRTELNESAKKEEPKAKKVNESHKPKVFIKRKK
jgi:hypothetical protein